MSSKYGHSKEVNKTHDSHNSLLTQLIETLVLELAQEKGFELFKKSLLEKYATNSTIITNLINQTIERNIIRSEGSKLLLMDYNKRDKQYTKSQHFSLLSKIIKILSESTTSKLAHFYSIISNIFQLYDNDANKEQDNRRGSNSIAVEDHQVDSETENMKHLRKFKTIDENTNRELSKADSKSTLFATEITENKDFLSRKNKRSEDILGKNCKDEEDRKKKLLKTVSYFNIGSSPFSLSDIINNNTPHVEYKDDPLSLSKDPRRSLELKTINENASNVEILDNSKADKSVIKLSQNAVLQGSLSKPKSDIFNFDPVILSKYRETEKHKQEAKNPAANDNQLPRFAKEND